MAPSSAQLSQFRGLSQIGERVGEITQCAKIESSVRFSSDQLGENIFAISEIGINHIYKLTDYNRIPDKVSVRRER